MCGLFHWCHQDEICSARPGNQAHTANIGNVMWWNEHLATEFWHSLGTFIHVCHCDVRVPVRVRTPGVRRVSRRVHHAGDVLTVLLEQGVDAERACINFLCRPAEQVSKKGAADFLVWRDEVMPDELTLVAHINSPLTHNVPICEVFVWVDRKRVFWQSEYGSAFRSSGCKTIWRKGEHQRQRAAWWVAVDAADDSDCLNGYL